MTVGVPGRCVLSPVGEHDRDLTFRDPIGGARRKGSFLAKLPYGGRERSASPPSGCKPRFAGFAVCTSAPQTQPSVGRTPRAAAPRGTGRRCRSRAAAAARAAATPRRLPPARPSGPAATGGAPAARRRPDQEFVPLAEEGHEPLSDVSEALVHNLRQSEQFRRALSSPPTNESPPGRDEHRRRRCGRPRPAIVFAGVPAVQAFLVAGVRPYPARSRGLAVTGTSCSGTAAEATIGNPIPE